MATTDPGLVALSRWYEQRITPPPDTVPQGKVLLKRENGTLTPINTEDLGTVDQLLCFFSRFFGIGNYALHNVAAIANRLLSQNPGIAVKLPNFIPTFNKMVEDYNSQTIVHIWRQHAQPLVVEEAPLPEKPQPPEPPPQPPVEKAKPTIPAPVAKPSQPSAEKQPAKEKLVGPRGNASTLSTNVSPYWKQYTRVGSLFDACLIKSDGHCMFRAYATGLLEEYKRMAAKLREKVVEICNGPLFPEPRPQNRINQVLSSIDLLNAGMSPEAIMEDEVISTAWIAILRHIAAEELKKMLSPLIPNILELTVTEKVTGDEEIDAIFIQSEIGDECRKTGQPISMDDIHLYLDRLAALQIQEKGKQVDNPLFGGQLAMRGLVHAFNIRVGIVNVHRCEQAIEGQILSLEGEKVGMSEFPSEVSQATAGIFLLQDGNHFNVGFLLGPSFGT